MAHAIQLTNPATHQVAIGYKGISWTCLLFGPFPALLRGHLLGFIVMAVALVPTFMLSHVFFIFFYNRWHFSWLIKKGFRPAGAVMGATQNVINVAVGHVGTEASAKAAV